MKNINWYPGHMKKTRELIQNSIKMVDVVIEVIDARIPVSSRNPIINQLVEGKPRVIILNKKDLSDPNQNKKWIEKFAGEGNNAIELNSMSGEGVNRLYSLLEKLHGEVIKTKLNRPLRMMIVGVPNAGKSSLINRMTGRKSTQTGDRPGVTKGKQWLTISGGMQLLDTPGILWPKFEDENIGEMIAFIGSINDMIIDIRELGLELIKWFIKNRPEILTERFEMEDGDDENAVLIKIANLRGCTKKGNELDYDKAASIFVNEFRSGKLGRVTLQMP